MNEKPVDHGRRRILLWSTTAVGAVGTVGLVNKPFIASWNPSARAEAAGAPVEIDVSKIAEGQVVKTEWRGKPVFVVRRSKNEVINLEKLNDKLKDPICKNADQQPEYVDKTNRAIREDIVVIVGLCTHLGCVPQHKTELEPEVGGGFFCPCHGSKFDLAGRVFKGVPASDNLEVPPYSYKNDDVIIIGIGQDEGVA